MSINSRVIKPAVVYLNGGVLHSHKKESATNTKTWIDLTGMMLSESARHKRAHVE